MGQKPLFQDLLEFQGSQYSNGDPSPKNAIIVAEGTSKWGRT